MSWVPTFLCPACGTTLTCSGGGPLRCESCQATVAQQASIYRALSRARAAALAPFVEQYRQVRSREGYTGRGPDYYNGLPDVPAHDPLAAQWRIRRRSYDRLRAILAEAFGARALRVADLGAGNGWLSHRLTTLGHLAVAVDASDDADDGLGAARHYGGAFVRVQADFDQLPLAPGQFDVVVFNGSLHYALDPAATIHRSANLLAPGGVLVVMDSPMFTCDMDGLAMHARQRAHLRAQHGIDEPLRAGAGYLTFPALQSVARALRARGAFHVSRGPLAWEARRLWSRVSRGLSPAAFGVWVARW